MKKIVMVLAVVALVLTAMTGCRKGLQNTRGVVKSMKITHDSLKSMVITYNEDGDTMLFSLKEARVQRGMMMIGDSVIVDFVDGKDDSLRALVVTTLSRPTRIIEEGVAPSDTLDVATMDELKRQAPAKKPEENQ
jgi:hypothetical protein